MLEGEVIPSCGPLGNRREQRPPYRGSAWCAPAWPEGPQGASRESAGQTPNGTYVQKYHAYKGITCLTYRCSRHAGPLQCILDLFKAVKMIRKKKHFIAEGTQASFLCRLQVEGSMENRCSVYVITARWNNREVVEQVELPRWAHSPDIHILPKKQTVSAKRLIGKDHKLLACFENRLFCQFNRNTCTPARYLYIYMVAAQCMYITQIQVKSFGGFSHHGSERGKCDHCDSDFSTVVRVWKLLKRL